MHTSHEGGTLYSILHPLFHLLPCHGHLKKLWPNIYNTDYRFKHFTVCGFGGIKHLPIVMQPSSPSILGTCSSSQTGSLSPGNTKHPSPWVLGTCLVPLPPSRHIHHQVLLFRLRCVSGPPHLSVRVPEALTWVPETASRIRPHPCAPQPIIHAAASPS